MEHGSGRVGKRKSGGLEWVWASFPGGEARESERERTAGDV